MGEGTRLMALVDAYGTSYLFDKQDGVDNARAAVEAELAAWAEVVAAAVDLSRYEDWDEPGCEFCGPDEPASFDAARRRVGAAVAALAARTAEEEGS
jgi:hypothetical protein